MTRIFAHRGNSSCFPENTLPAFEDAVKLGASGIELDVHLTKDAQLVVIHDETLARTTNGRGWIKDLTLVEIQKFNAGGEISTKVPTLTEVLSLLVKLNFTGQLNIEIKTDIIHYTGIEEQLAEVLQSQTWPFSLVISSFYFPSLEKMANLMPTLDLAYLFVDEMKKAQLAEKSAFISALHPKISWVIQQEKNLANYSKPIRPWTVNKEEQMTFCFQQQVAGLFTDYPQKAIKLSEEFNG
ncbi:MULTISPECIES: glycerophosphodiester phosphodiesterase [unclassified Enterococcus]|uniref:glycerophosphodiester phosphodiesterase n=1 Tax=unclassified Enterococcus TaxID=2608891 RepID=UPI0024733A86|nr:MULTISPECIES: glycerophosphodiester phosphodiesterase [unclassified Enterococcus]